MTPPISLCRASKHFALAALIAAAIAATTFPARAQQVVLLVNGTPITDLDIAHRQKFLEMSTHKKPSRQEAIDSLVDETLELREAQRYSLDPSDADVQQAYENVAEGMGVDTQNGQGQWTELQDPSVTDQWQAFRRFGPGPGPGACA